MKNLGAKIFKRRKELKLSQEKLGSAIGVSGPTISMWEAGQNLPKTENFFSLAKALNLTVDELLEDVDMTFIDDEVLLALLKNSFPRFSSEHREKLMRILLQLESQPD